MNRLLLCSLSTSALPAPPSFAINLLVLTSKTIGQVPLSALQVTSGTCVDTSCVLVSLMIAQITKYYIMALQVHKSESGCWLADAPRDTRPGSDSLYDAFYQKQRKKQQHKHTHVKVSLGSGMEGAEQKHVQTLDSIINLSTFLVWLFIYNYATQIRQSTHCFQS